MTTVVISQPMLFPWPGFFELVSVADVYVHLDDAQFSKGSFTNRIQIKTETGLKWMTVPLQRGGSFQRINQLHANEGAWKEEHRRLLVSALSHAPHFKMAIELFERVYRVESLPELLQTSIVDTFSLIAANKQVTWLKASDLNVRGTSWQRVLDIVLAVGGTRYVTAHGAKDYLAHECFEDAGIEVEYINYSKSPYGQRFGEFTPSVSILDAIANLGLGASNIISPTTKPWRAFLRSAF